MATDPATTPTQPDLRDRDRFITLFALAFGMVLTLAVSGYQFGRGNHTVYLLDGLRAVHPELLRNDWFSTQTLQYHACFSLITQCLLRLHILEPAFLIGYLALIVMWHIFWWQLVQAIGGDERIYLLSVFLFYLSAAGISLGVFQFLQDGCFLPSNVANVLMLGGITDWVRGRRIAAGVWLGIAGLFHVNYAVVAIGLWGGLIAWEWIDKRPQIWLAPLMPACLRGDSAAATSEAAPWRTWTATLLVLLPSLFNIGLAVPAELRHGGTMPMVEFVRVYVQFRHDHHFDPIHWPAVLWLSFLWPIPLVVVIARRWNGSESLHVQHREACRVFALLFPLLVIAFLFAGVWFINEPLVQLCLWRFSIYIKLMSCIAAAIVFCDERLISRTTLRGALWVIAIVSILVYGGFLAIDPNQHGPVWMLAFNHRIGIGIVIGLWTLLAIEQSLRNARPFHVIGFIALPLLALIAWPRLGVGMTPEPDDAQYRQVCLWAKDPAHTPIDAIFLVPAQETDFRLYAERAIVVNYKHVPQLSGEIVEWKKRLLDVLGVPSVSVFGHDYTHTIQMIARLYENRSPADLFNIAEKYDARYIVVNHSLGPQYAAGVVFHREDNPYMVYDRLALTNKP